jgi:signal transduction histidine kinase
VHAPATANPRWLVPLVCALPIAAAGAVMLERIGTPTASWSIPLAGATGLPWLAAALGLDFPRWPAAAFFLGVTALLVWYPVNQDAAPFQLIALVSVTALLGSTRETIAVWAGSVGVMAAADLAGRFVGSTNWILGISLGVLGGYSFKAQEHVQASRLAQAAVEERQRIARELHDVVAHSLAVTMLNLTGARRALRRDPDEADAALRQAEESGRQSLADIRRAVGLLGNTGTLAPMPVANDIEVLVREFSDAGLRVTLSVQGDLNSLSAGTGLALYRIAQESLANVVKHSTEGEARVALLVGPDSVCISIDNPRRGSNRAAPDDGVGIAGMRERVALVGGTLAAGPSGTGWRVVAELPIGVT